MKPKTKLEKRVVELSKQLRPITQKQADWGYDNCLGKYFVHSRKTSFCLECGAWWKPEEDGSKMKKTICPDCGCEIEKYKGYNGAAKDCVYYAILTTTEKFQVIRMIWLQKDMKKKQHQDSFYSEVMQHWIDEKGNVTSLLKKVQCLNGGCYDRWIFGSELEIRQNSYGCQMRCSIDPWKIYPGRRILPIIKRNGFKGYFHGFSPQEFFSRLLSENRFETLLKANQIGLMRESVMSGRIVGYWSSIKICIRNNYKPVDASIYLDYIRLLRWLDKDYRNPKFVCPENLIQEHDRLVHLKKEIEEKREKEERRKDLERRQALYEREKSAFFGLVIETPEIKIKPLESIQEFIDEGEKLNHCLYANNYDEKKDALIMSARIGGEPIETIEFNLKNLSVSQCRGKNNQPTEYHEQILKIINSNRRKIAERIERID